MIGIARTAQRGQRHDARARRYALLCLAAMTALSFSFVQDVAADNPWARSRNAWGSKPNAWSSMPNAWGSAPNAWGNSKSPWANSQHAWGGSPSAKEGAGAPSNFGGYMAIPSEAIVALPSMEPRLKKHIDTGAIPDGLQAPQRRTKRAARHRQIGLPERDEFAPRSSQNPQRLE